jgi:hypothetical protein
LADHIIADFRHCNPFMSGNQHKKPPVSTWVALIAHGEGWHNNHQRFQNKNPATFGNDETVPVFIKGATGGFRRVLDCS